ncbi:DUF2917 domain-containing protein [Herbaspirillum seropedicae]|uniref:DUF2917 domain-containing protein n=1 Tax=Herbaspirillum seropedicae TaxID=964 RepID=UPI00112212FD|nr:DUF2917 domain-containing protein [Herbaspirillum seropedicae]QDD66978.1 DUF2917 domain-containing protein [Herbaspirillum seropedicae]
MSIPFATETPKIRLAAGQTHALVLHGAACIRVHQGLVWLTVEQGGADVWLSAGRSFDVQGRGLAVLEAAHGAAEFDVQMQPGWGRRLLRWLRGPGRPPVASSTSSATPPSCGETVRVSRLLPHGLIRWF